MRIDLTLAQINAVKLMLGEAFDEDEKLALDTIEGETDAFELARHLLSNIEDQEGVRAALTEQMDARKLRRDRCDARIKSYRDAIAAILMCAKLDKLSLPEATLSVRMTDPKLVVNDNDAVPEEYCASVIKPSLEKIKASFSPDDETLPNWLRVEDARPSLTVRRK